MKDFEVHHISIMLVYCWLMSTYNFLVSDWLDISWVLHHKLSFWSVAKVLPLLIAYWKLPVHLTTFLTLPHFEICCWIFLQKVQAIYVDIVSLQWVSRPYFSDTRNIILILYCKSRNAEKIKERRLIFQFFFNIKRPLLSFSVEN